MAEPVEVTHHIQQAGVCRRERRQELAALEGDATHWLTDPGFEVLRYRLKRLRTRQQRRRL